MDTHTCTHADTHKYYLAIRRNEIIFLESNRHRKKNKKEREDMCKKVLKRGQALCAPLPGPVSCWLSQELGQKVFAAPWFV